MGTWIAIPPCQGFPKTPGKIPFFALAATHFGIDVLSGRDVIARESDRSGGADAADQRLGLRPDLVERCEE